MRFDLRQPGETQTPGSSCAASGSTDHRFHFGPPITRSLALPSQRSGIDTPQTSHRHLWVHEGISDRAPSSCLLTVSRTFRVGLALDARPLLENTEIPSDKAPRQTPTWQVCFTTAMHSALKSAACLATCAGLWGCGSDGAREQGQSVAPEATDSSGSTSENQSEPRSSTSSANDGSSSVLGDETSGDESRRSDDRTQAPTDTATATSSDSTAAESSGETTTPSALRPVCAWEYRDADGTLDRRWEMGYDENGFMNFRGIDDDGDGVLDVMEHWTNDERGNQLTREVDRNGDGITDRKEFSQYDEHDNLVRFESDENMDGVMDRLDLHTYDEQNRIVSTVYDREGNGVTVDRLDYTYDTTAEGTLQTEILDWGVDGVVDRITLRLYDAEGRLLDEQRDDGDDGVLESHTSYEYDSRGNRLAERSNFRTLEWQYDAQDRVVSETETREDGSISVIKTYEYTSSDTGYRIDIYTDYDGDGERDYAEAEHYDADGNLLFHEVDIGADGTIDLVRTIFFECS